MDVKALIQTGLENVQRSIDRTLEGLTPAELKWQPRTDANSIGLILFHIARAEDSFIQSMIQGKPQLWESGKWYQKLNKSIEDRGAHYTAQQVAAFVVPEMKDLREYAEAVRKLSLEYLKNLTPEKLDKKVDLPPMGPPPESTPGGKVEAPRKPPFEPVVGAILLMTVIHAAEHAGEISYLRGLQRGMDK